MKFSQADKTISVSTSKPWHFVKVYLRVRYKKRTNRSSWQAFLFNFPNARISTCRQNYFQLLRKVGTNIQVPRGSTYLGICCVIFTKIFGINMNMCCGLVVSIWNMDCSDIVNYYQIVLWLFIKSCLCFFYFKIMYTLNRRRWDFPWKCFSTRVLHWLSSNIVVP